MAACVARLYGTRLLKVKPGATPFQVCSFSTTNGWSRGKKLFLTSIGVVTGSAGALIYALEQSFVNAGELELHPPKLPWSHNGLFSTYDHASIRRGFEVYKNVCAACHGLQYVAYRELIGVCFTEEEAKAEAEEQMIEDGPDDTGAYFKRPGKLSDYFPSPYPNEEAARAANNGAYPPDLTYITMARHGGENYVFSLLTGYCDAPAGITIREGQYYNPYFPGGAIGMAQALYNEIIEYSDGTPASQSQLAKDVCTFLSWAANPDNDTRQLFALKTLFISSVILGMCIYWKRHKWTVLKSRKIAFKPPSKPTS
ncbi:cytochrome c1 [Lycorma delicatula]|uniref:cytochrome c1 n=1 Tax=Lycorma delicatula TaxID=130591 RepID=UPI003F51A549